MYRGTTPKLIFSVNFDVAEVSTLWITFKQSKNIMFEKQLADCVLDSDNSQIICDLSEQETLQLLPNVDLDIQLRVGFNNGKKAVSKLITTYVNDILHDGEI